MLPAVSGLPRDDKGYVEVMSRVSDPECRPIDTVALKQKLHGPLDPGTDELRNTYVEVIDPCCAIVILV